MTLDLTHPIAGNRYQHRKGGTYTALGAAKVQTDEPLADYAEVVVYQSEDAERSIWVRPVGEFTDGRFTPIEGSAAPTTDAALAERYHDKAEGLSADLDGAVEKLWEVGGDEGREWVGWNYAKTAERLRREDEAALASAPPPAVSDAVGVPLLLYDALVRARENAREKDWPGDVKRLQDHIDAISSIEPTPSPEPQASNAGAVEPGWKAVHDFRGAWGARWCQENLPERLETIDQYHDREWRAFLALLERVNEAECSISTPEPQTGERDGEVKAWLMGDPATGQWIEVDGYRVAYSRGMGTPAHVLAEAFKAERGRADTAEGNANRWKARAEAAERRLAEVKERAREALDDKTRDAAMDAAYKFVFPKLSDMQKEKGAVGVWVDAFRTAWDAAARAALRAKPEAHTLVGMEGDR